MRLSLCQNTAILALQLVHKLRNRLITITVKQSADRVTILLAVGQTRAIMRALQ
ncbi:hypothetical protein F2Q70_00003859 [Brassica cretica]|uniref:Uncharacterized protein n=1 Tax=Brassica cretica TaxID=69181 RepID=A0A8S9IZL2_BRACR|nr:hypothetical protein F2Q70_00003859 [Brassica cretica]